MGTKLAENLTSFILYPPPPPTHLPLSEAKDTYTNETIKQTHVKTIEKNIPLKWKIRRLRECFK